MRRWKLYALVASASHTQLVTSWVENRLLACVSFSKLVQFHIHPPYIFTIPDWLNVKFHYFLIGPKVKILNTLTRLAPIYVTLCPVSQPVWTPSCALLVSLNVQAWLMWFPSYQDLRCPKAVEVYNINCSKKFPESLILTLTNGDPASSLYPPKQSVSVPLSCYTGSLQFPFYPNLNY